MNRSTLISSAAACFCIGLTISAIEAQTPASGMVNNSSPSAKSGSAAEPVPIADVPRWRQQQIATARPVTSTNTPFRSDELVGIDVCNSQDEVLGDVEHL